jgi:two-component system, sensor histidine kinase and response regulator
MKENKKYSVLIVDDVSQNIQVVASILRNEGFEIGFALNGPDALEALKNSSFDLILLDIMMPGMSGFDVITELKKDHSLKEIPVIFLTAKTDIESLKTGFRLGGVDYVTKPFNSDELTARVNTHIQLSEQKMKLKELNNTKDKFFSIIAHDLKNPLGSLVGLCQQLFNNMDIKNNELGEYFSVICESIQMTYNLMENLLEWSKVQIGKSSFEPEEIQLAKTVKRIIPFFDSQRKDKKLTIEVDIDNELVVLADENMLKTILRNLISNAIKFTLRGGMISIGANKVNKYVEIYVKDNGIGISEKEMPKLFRLDTHVSTPGTENEKGTGLGLILCREFVEKNDGTIHAESEEGAGTTFYFTLPAKNPSG